MRQTSSFFPGVVKASQPTLNGCERDSEDYSFQTALGHTNASQPNKILFSILPALMDYLS